MTTLVYKTSNDGNLQQVQIGAADIVATFSAASTAWGWIGGLDGLRNVFEHIPNLIRPKALAKLTAKVQFHPACCRLLTSRGVCILQDEDTRNYFGGHQVTQVIGQTICALAHIMGPDRALRLFTDYLSPYLLKGDDGVSEAFEAQLTDNLDRILNEAASRGLNKRFDRSLAALHIPLIPELMPRKSWDFGESNYVYVAGLLKWLTNDDTQSYRTRSAIAAQVAACLREVGFAISAVITWNGQDMAHNLRGGVILVTGGHSETDQYMLDQQPPGLLDIIPRIHHYRFKTVGSLLFNMLTPEKSMYPATLEADFARTHRFIDQNLSYTWAFRDTNKYGLHAAFQWSARATETEPNPASMALAAIYFGTSASVFAQCFDAINTPEVLTDINNWKDESYAQTPLSVSRFKGIATSIVLSVASKLAGPNFSELSHCTKVNLRGSQLRSLAVFVDQILSRGIAYWQAVTLVAVFHSAATVDILHRDHPDLIGFRLGDHAVLPELFFQMSPTPQSLGLRCVEDFFVLAAVQSDGTIRSSTGDSWSPDSWALNIDEEASTGADTRVASHSNPRTELPGIKTGAPMPTSADTDIYVSLERDSYANATEPAAVLAARRNGQLIGLASITDAQQVIAKSQSIPYPCVTEHSPRAQATILPTSQWAKNRLYKPTDQIRYSNYIPCAGHNLWALFLAGQVWQVKGRGYLVRDCYDCALETAKSLDNDFRVKETGGVFIGYHLETQSKDMLAIENERA